MELFESAEKGCIEYLSNNNLSSYSKEDISKAINIAMENGNVDYFEKLREIQSKICPAITPPQTPHHTSGASSLVAKEFVHPVTAKKCPHGSTVGHQIIQSCIGGISERCCNRGCTRCSGREYIDYDCVHGFIKPHTYIAGFCNGP